MVHHYFMFFNVWTDSEINKEGYIKPAWQYLE